MEHEQEEQGGRIGVIGRVAAIAALLLAVLVVALVTLGGDGGYRVKVRFQAATQMVEGNLVQSGGRQVGTVEQIELTPDGEAELTLALDEDIAPLRQGTRATLRIASLSGVVNRYVDLQIPPAGGAEIADGGVIPSDRTQSAVDLDQLFNTFDRRTRKGLQDFIRGTGAQYANEGEAANAGWEHLNPSLVAARRLFAEVNRDTPMLERFVVESARLMGDLAEREDDVAALVDNAATFTGALAREERNLSAAIGELPPFLRRANTTFVNLRDALDDVDPLIEASRPVTPKLRRVLAELRPFAISARPVVRALADTVRRDGRANDLIDLGRAVLPFRDIAIGPVNRNGKARPGAFATTTRSLRGQRPHLAHFRPYANDFTGWVDDFSHSGIYDANGSASRSALSVNALAVAGSQLFLIPPELRNAVFDRVATRRQTNRCPGSIERPRDGGNPWKPSNVNCDPKQVPPGR